MPPKGGNTLYEIRFDCGGVSLGKIREFQWQLGFCSLYFAASTINLLSEFVWYAALQLPLHFLLYVLRVLRDNGFKTLLCAVNPFLLYVLHVLRVNGFEIDVKVFMSISCFRGSASSLYLPFHRVTAHASGSKVTVGRSYI